MSDDDPELARAPNTLRMLQEDDKASVTFGKRINIAAGVKQGLIDAGFEDVTDVVRRVCLTDTLSSLNETCLLTDIMTASHRHLA